MAGLRTTLDLIQDALEKAGEKSDGTSEYQSFALVQMNQRYKQILSGAMIFETNLGSPWPWAKARYPNILILEPAYDTGTVSLTEDSTSGTFSSAPTTSMAGRFLKLADRPDFMRIASHTANTTGFTLDAAYTDATISGAEFAAHKLDYDLGASGGTTSGILRLFAPMKVHKSQSAEADGSGTISSLPQLEFDKKYPLTALRTGTPTEFTQVHAEDGIISIRFNKSADEKIRVEYDYIPVPTELTYEASSIPVVPEAYRDILSLVTAHDILLDKEDDKAQVFFGMAKAGLQALVSAQRKEQTNTRRNFGRIVPRLDQVTSRFRWDTQD